GLAPALGDRRGPRPRPPGRARRHPPDPRRRLRPRAAEHDRPLPHLVRLSPRRDLPLRRGANGMKRPSGPPPAPDGSPVPSGPPPAPAAPPPPARGGGNSSRLELTAQQADAARAGPEGAFLVAAGPGTGKTFTMVQRFRWLVEEVKVPPDQVLAVTFTEAAAAELRERLGMELGQPLEDAWIGTFHGVCARLLREHAYLVGIAREVRVLDELG